MSLHSTPGYRLRTRPYSLGSYAGQFGFGESMSDPGATNTKAESREKETGLSLCKGDSALWYRAAFRALVAKCRRTQPVEAGLSNHGPSGRAETEGGGGSNGASRPGHRPDGWFPVAGGSLVASSALRCQRAGLRSLKCGPQGKVAWGLGGRHGQSRRHGRDAAMSAGISSDGI